MTINNKQQIYFDNYVAIDNIINDDNILLLKGTDENFYVQKIVPKYQKSIYEYLITNHISNTPKIYNLKESNNNLIVLCEYINGNTLTDFLNDLFLNKTCLLQTNNHFTFENKQINNDFDCHNSNNKDLILHKKNIIKLFYKHIYTLLDVVHNFQKSKIIIHRDIKPDNIIITKDYELYLIDFDTAKVYEENKTKDTHLLGSEGYAAPEQYGFGSSNKSTDIYAIGKVMNDYIDIIDDEKLSKKILPIIDKCCKIDYKDRYQSIGHIKSDLFRAEHNILFLAIPGFRSNKSFHMAIATFFYILLFYVCFFNTYINIGALNICIFISILSFIFIFFNYLDVHRFLPFAKSKNLILRYLSTFLYSLIIPVVYIVCFIVFHK